MKPDLYFETVSMHITGTNRSDLIKRNERHHINCSFWVVDSGESVQQLRLSNFDLYIVCLILSCNYISTPLYYNDHSTYRCLPMLSVYNYGDILT